MQTFTSITMEAIGSVASAWDDSRTARRVSLCSGLRASRHPDYLERDWSG